MYIIEVTIAKLSNPSESYTRYASKVLPVREGQSWRDVDTVDSQKVAKTWKTKSGAEKALIGVVDLFDRMSFKVISDDNK